MRSGVTHVTDLPDGRHEPLRRTCHITRYITRYTARCTPVAHPLHTRCTHVTHPLRTRYAHVTHLPHGGKEDPYDGRGDGRVVGEEEGRQGHHPEPG